MIKRYSLPEMARLFEDQARFEFLLEVEKSVAKVQGRLGLIPESAAKEISEKATFDLSRIEEIEKTTRHDVIAFVSSVAESLSGDAGPYVHFGLTSSDVLDTAQSLCMKRALEVWRVQADLYEQALMTLIEAEKETLCAGRTHGMHAEPTTFGFKVAGFLSEWDRVRKLVEQAGLDFQRVKLSGAVGTSSFLSPDVEAEVGALLGLKPEPMATQVVPRDRHAFVFFALCAVANHLERISVELRHLQRTEVAEVYEGFQKGQKGSSAMPHKKNPISAENLTGVARLMRGYLQAGLENVALWHERDISHSSVERVAWADAWILSHYSLNRMAGVLNNLVVDRRQMLKNVELSKGQMFSSHLLLMLIEKGLSRETAYQKVQGISHNGEGHLLEKVKASELSSLLDASELEDLFSGKIHVSRAKTRVDDFLALRGKL